MRVRGECGEHAESGGEPGAEQEYAEQLDSAGNLTVSAVYEYGNLVTPARTYNYSYLTDANYTNRWTRNRVTQVTMNGTVLVTNTYDGYTAGPCSPVAGLTGADGLGLARRRQFRSGVFVPGERDVFHVVGRGSMHEV